MKPTVVLAPLVTMLCLLACGGRSDQRFEPARLRGPAELSLSLDGTLGGVPSGEVLAPHESFESYLSNNISVRVFSPLVYDNDAPIEMQCTLGDGPPDENLPNAGYVIGGEYPLDVLIISYNPPGDRIEFVSEERVPPQIRVLRIIGDSTDDRDDIVEFELSGTIRSRDLSREVRVTGTFKYDFRRDKYPQCVFNTCTADDFR